jgi:hypothetical protein
MSPRWRWWRARWDGGGSVAAVGVGVLRDVEGPPVGPMRPRLRFDDDDEDAKDEDGNAEDDDAIFLFDCQLSSAMYDTIHTHTLSQLESRVPTGTVLGRNETPLDKMSNDHGPPLTRSAQKGERLQNTVAPIDTIRPLFHEPCLLAPHARHPIKGACHAGHGFLNPRLFGPT